MLLEKSSQWKQQQKDPVVVMIKPVPAKTTKGFEINSPKSQTPSGSGRNSPDEEMKQNRTKEVMRNARELFEKERGEEKQQIHLVVIGHVDAGKSTMMGHLLYDLGNVPQRVMHKYEQESKKMGKQSFMYAWVLDETGEERTRGITMDCGYQRFETPSKQVSLIFNGILNFDFSRVNLKISKFQKAQKIRLFISRIKPGFARILISARENSLRKNT
jgi:hypothetical protein